MTIKIIKDQLKNIPKTSGVYKYFDINNNILYVGKAKNLYNRISSYTREKNLSPRISRMVFLARKIEFIETKTEIEALLLEHNLIKQLLPRFNILLRDDKTFPEIFINNHDFPGIFKYRGSRSKNNSAKKGYFFGPFASGFDVSRTIEALRKIFMIRNCSDSEFKSRKKPCLEYQIKKCLGPCVNYVTKEEYSESISQAKDFLKGKSSKIQKILTKNMLAQSQKENYEKAAQIRDQIKSLDAIQAKQDININNLNDSDIITIVKLGNAVCIYVSFYRSGRNLGARPYYFEIEQEKKLDILLSEFMGQFYLSHSPANTVITNIKINDQELIEVFLNEISDKKITLKIAGRGKKLELIKNQEDLALQNLTRKISQNLSNKDLHLEMKKAFSLSKMPKLIEIYDNSHTSFQNAVGCMVRANLDGFIKSGYRKFNIKFETSNKDDTAMMKEVFYRRFSKLNKEDYPDLIIIDGGKGQINAANLILRELKVKIAAIGMSKGENRNAGEEYFHQENKESFTLQKNSPLMYYMQRLRDEAHRFAIMTHRKRRGKNMLQ